MTLQKRPRLDEYPDRPVRSGQPRRIFVCDSYFDPPLSLTAAYWLGFLFADGSVTLEPRWTLTVNLAMRDRGHIEKLQREIGGRILDGKRNVRLLVHSRKLCLTLARLGVVPRKSMAPAEPPRLKRIAKLNFLRGMMDGDGCLHVNKRGYLQLAFAGHRDMVAWFVSAVKIVTGMKHNGIRLRGKTAYAQWTTPSAAEKIVAKIYGADGPVLERKAKIAEGFIP